MNGRVILYHTPLDERKAYLFPFDLQGFTLLRGVAQLIARYRPC